MLESQRKVHYSLGSLNFKAKEKHRNEIPLGLLQVANFCTEGLRTLPQRRKHDFLLHGLRLLQSANLQVVFLRRHQLRGHLCKDVIKIDNFPDLDWAQDELQVKFCLDKRRLEEPLLWWIERRCQSSVNFQDFEGKFQMQKMVQINFIQRWSPLRFHFSSVWDSFQVFSWKFWQMEVHWRIQQDSSDYHDWAQGERSNWVQHRPHSIQHWTSRELALVDADAASDLRQDELPRWRQGANSYWPDRIIPGNGDKEEDDAVTDNLQPKLLLQDNANNPLGLTLQLNKQAAYSDLQLLLILQLKR